MAKRVSGFRFPPASAPLFLLVVCVLAYGLLIPQLGFYWDDLLSVWMRYQLGPEAMARCFSVSRPVLGTFFQITTSIIPPEPFYWQVFALFWRWVTGVSLWALIRCLWPEENRFAVGVSLLFLVYPGFNQQFVAFVYSHYFAVLAFYLISLLCTAWSLRHPRWFWPLTLLSLLLAAANLWMLEYFFFLELLRPVVIWLALRATVPGFRARSRRAATIWLPYLAVFLLTVLWRLFIFNDQIYAYNFALRFRAEFFEAPLSLAQTVLTSLWSASAAAWSRVFTFPDPNVWESGAILSYVAVVLGAGVILLVYLFRSHGNLNHNEDRTRDHAPWAVGLGLFALLIAGWPFWLIDFHPSLGFPSNRFTLPLMLGVSLLLAGLLELLPRKRVRVIIMTALVSLAVGRHFLWANEYRREWDVQTTLFWQLSWRVPALKPDTLLLMNDGALRYYADNSLSAPLNWIYAPDDRSEHISFVLFHPRSRLGGSLPSLEKDQPIRYNFIAGTFTGNTSQAIAFYFRPPACLRVLDPDLDAVNPLIPELMRAAAPLSRTDTILPEGTPHLPELYYPEPPHDWCYYFEKADLARQQGDWQRVVELGDEAFGSGHRPYDPVERFVFIEGYAHVGNWERARRLSLQSYYYSPFNVGPLLCGLWERIAATTPDTPEKQSIVQVLWEEINCYP